MDGESKSQFLSFLCFVRPCNALQAVKLLHARQQHTQLSNSGSLKQIQSPRSSSEEQQNKQKGVKGNTPAREANTNVQRTYKELHFKNKSYIPQMQCLCSQKELFLSHSSSLA